MNVIIFGATGMVGQGVLRECLPDDGVTRVLAIGRNVTGRTHAKLREIADADLLERVIENWNINDIAAEASGEPKGAG